MYQRESKSRKKVSGQWKEAGEPRPACWTRGLAQGLKDDSPPGIQQKNSPRTASSSSKPELHLRFPSLLEGAQGSSELPSLRNSGNFYYLATFSSPHTQRSKYSNNAKDPTWEMRCSVLLSPHHHAHCRGSKTGSGEICSHSLPFEHPIGTNNGIF